LSARGCSVFVCLNIFIFSCTAILFAAGFAVLLTRIIHHKGTKAQRHKVNLLT